LFAKLAEAIGVMAGSREAVSVAQTSAAVSSREKKKKKKKAGEKADRKANKTEGAGESMRAASEEV